LIFLEDSNALVVSMGFKFHEISQINEVLLSELLKISNFAKNTTALLNEIYLLNQQIELN